MSHKILINAVDPEECRIARVKESKLEEFHIESSAREITRGNIYKAVISRVEPSLQAAFVDYGAAGPDHQGSDFEKRGHAYHIYISARKICGAYARK